MIIDDFGISGCHIRSIIDKVASKIKTNLNFQIFLGASCFTSYITSSLNRRYTQIQGISVYSGTKLKSLAEIADKDHLQDYDIFELLGSEDGVTPFFTDHKIPNVFGSFPQIYLLGCLDTNKSWKNCYGHLFKTKPSRKAIGRIELKYSQVNRLQEKLEDGEINDKYVDSDGDLYL